MGILALFVPAGRWRTLPVTRMTHSLRSAAALLEKFLGQIRGIKNGLRAAFAVADIDEDEAAEVAAGMDPAGQSDGLPDVRRAQFVAMMRSFHVQTTDEQIRGCSKALSANPCSPEVILRNHKPPLPRRPPLRSPGTSDVRRGPNSCRAPLRPKKS